MDLVDIIEIESNHLLPGEDLEEFLCSPADTERLTNILRTKIVSQHIKALFTSRIIRFNNADDGIEIEIMDLRPGGSSGTIREFEERLIMFLAKGFEEFQRQGSNPTRELECQRCMKILPPSSTKCGSCGSTNLKGATIPASISLRNLEHATGRTNGELLDRIWELANYLAIEPSK